MPFFKIHCLSILEIFDQPFLGMSVQLHIEEKETRSANIQDEHEFDYGLLVIEIHHQQQFRLAKNR